MVMNFPGVREHYAFYAYHLARVLESLCLIAATVSWGLSNAAKRFILGSMFLMWEAFEVSYLITRSGQATFGHENFFGVITIDSVFIVCCIHAARTATGLWLLRAGR